MSVAVTARLAAKHGAQQFSKFQLPRSTAAPTQPPRLAQLTRLRLSPIPTRISYKQVPFKPIILGECWLTDNSFVFGYGVYSAAYNDADNMHIEQ